MKLVSNVKGHKTFVDLRKEFILEKYDCVKKNIEKGFYHEGTLHGFELALTILGYDIEEVDQ